MRKALIALTLALSACSAVEQQAGPHAGPIASPSSQTSNASPSAAEPLPTASKTVDQAVIEQEAMAAGEFVPVPQHKLRGLAVWSGTTVEGANVSTADLIGRRTVVNFWASWCGPCKAEWPLLQAASAQFPEINFVGIDTQDSLAHAKAWLETNPTNYQHFYDDRAIIKASLTTVPNMGMPITVILDEQGRITAWFSGGLNEKALTKILS